MPEDKLLSLSEFAALMRYKPRYVTRLKAEGRLVMQGRKVLLQASRARIQATMDPKSPESRELETKERALTKSEFALVQNWRPSYVSLLSAEGRLVMDGNKVLLQASRARIRETADPSKQAVADRHAAHRAAKAAAEAAPQSNPGAGQGSEPEASPAVAVNEPQPANPELLPFQQAKAKKEHYQALAAERDYQQSMGELLSRSDVVAAIRNATTTLRSGLESAPGQLAPRLAVISDEAQIRALLAEDLEYRLNELSRSLHQLAGGGSQ